MYDWLWFVGFFFAYIVLLRWVMPRLGVPTCMSSIGSVESRRPVKEKNQSVNNVKDLSSRAGLECTDTSSN